MTFSSFTELTPIVAKVVTILDIDKVEEIEGNKEMRCLKIAPEHCIIVHGRGAHLSAGGEESIQCSSIESGPKGCKLWVDRRADLMMVRDPDVQKNLNAKSDLCAMMGKPRPAIVVYSDALPE